MLKEVRSNVCMYSDERTIDGTKKSPIRCLDPQCVCSGIYDSVEGVCVCWVGIIAIQCACG